MKRILVRYRTKAESTDENERLVRAVFDELAEKKPENVRYATIRLEDGTFVHIVEMPDDDNPLKQIESWRIFQQGVEGRCDELPKVRSLTMIGNYGMFAT